TRDRGCSSFPAGGCDGNRAVARHIELGAGLFDEGSDHLAAWSNHVASLVRIDLDLDDARRVWRDVGAWLGDGLLHHAEDIEPALLRLLEGFGHDLRI